MLNNKEESIQQHKHSSGFWEDINNQKKYFDWFENKMNFKDKSDWYLITVREIKNHGGSGLLEKYNGSLQYALKSIYPNYEWIPWLFSVSPGFWEDINNQRKYFDWFENKMNFKDKSDWYSITIKKINNHGGSGLLRKYNDSLQHALKSIYPNYEWIPWLFSVSPRILGKY